MEIFVICGKPETLYHKFSKKNYFRFQEEDIMRKLLVQFVVFAVILVVAACQKKRPEPSWDVDVLSPLLLDTVFITDVISDTLITVNADKSVSFVFEEQLYEVNADSLVKLPDTIFNWSFKVPIEITIPPNGAIIENFDWPLDFESIGLADVKIEKAVIRSGKLRFEVLNALSKDILCEFGINSAVKNETDTFLVSQMVNTGELTLEEFDISEYHLNLVGLEDSAYNSLNYFIGLYNDDEALLVQPTDSFMVNIRFVDIVLDYAKGYFGQNVFPFGPDEYPVTLFEELDMEGFSFNEANVNLIIENNYGLQAYFKILQMSAINSSTGDFAMLESELVDSNLYLSQGFETIPGSGIIEPSLHSFDFSEANFGELFSVLPDKLIYTVEVQTNIDGDTTNFNNFFYYDEPIRIHMKAEINQGVQIDDMFVNSTTSWNSNGVELENVSEGNLVLVFTNGFPFTLDADLFLLDENYDVIDTLVTDGFISGGLLNEDLSVEEPVETRINVELTESLKESLSIAKYSRYALYINSVDNEHVKIFADDLMKVKVIGDFSYLIEQ